MEELIRRARESIIDADEDEAMNLIREARARQLDVMELLRLGFAAGNNEVGSLFEAGQITAAGDHDRLYLTSTTYRKLYDQQSIS